VFSKPIVDVVEIRLPPVMAVYHATLIWKVPVSSPAGTFTYPATAYEVPAVTAIREAIETPEFDAAAFVTSRQEEPKNASVVVRAIVEEPVADQPVALVLNEGLTIKLFLAMLCSSATKLECDLT
jgi:hypothetical protein